MWFVYPRKGRHHEATDISDFSRFWSIQESEGPNVIIEMQNSLVDQTLNQLAKRDKLVSNNNPTFSEVPEADKLIC